MTTHLLYFFMALVATVLGTIPFGPINLSVVNITLKKSLKAVRVFILAAALVEIIQALVSIFFGAVVDKFLMDNAWFQWLAIAVFLGAGIFILLRKSKPKEAKPSRFKVPTFFQGFIVAALNPQAVPFWLISLAVIAKITTLDFAEYRMLSFLLGVFAGKYLALTGFALFSQKIKGCIKEGSRIVDIVFGSVLIAIALIQAFKTLW